MTPPLDEATLRRLTPDELTPELAQRIYDFAEARCCDAHGRTREGSMLRAICVCGHPTGGPSGRPFCDKLATLAAGGDETAWLATLHALLDETGAVLGAPRP